MSGVPDAEDGVDDAAALAAASAGNHLDEVSTRALRSIDDRVYRTGAPATQADLAAAAERFGLTGAQSAKVRTAARENGLIEPERRSSLPDRAGLAAARADATKEALRRETAEVLGEPVDALLKAAHRYALLSAAEERSLSRQYHEGTRADEALSSGAAIGVHRAELELMSLAGRQAKERLICSNLRLVVWNAKSYRNQGLEWPDVVHDGVVGLNRAVEKFDPKRGFKLSTYATWWIRQSIARGLADKGRVIRLPVHVVDRVRKIGSHTRRLERRLGREPTDEEIAVSANVEVADVVFVREVAQPVISLDAHVSEDGESTLVEFQRAHGVSVEAEVMDSSDKEAVAELLQHLPERERRVIEGRYGLNGRDPLTLDQLGRVHGVTRERIRQLQQTAEKKLLELAEEAGLRPGGVTRETAPIAIEPRTQNLETRRSSEEARRAQQSALVARRRRFEAFELAGLTPDEQAVVDRRYIRAHAMSVGEAAAALGRSPAWIFEMQRSALRKLKTYEEGTRP